MRTLSYLLATLLTFAPASRVVVAAPAEVIELDDFALYIPADVSTVRGIFLALGGPDTRAFVTDGLFGSPVAETEASLHVLGQELRAFAADQRITILGSSLRGQSHIPNLPRTDQLVFEAIAEAAEISGRPELTRAPILMYGMSGGTMQAAGFAARNPSRVIALLLKVSGPPERLSGAEALAVPSYVLFAEHDQFNENSAAIEAIEFNRRAGGLWAFAVEPGVPHHSMTTSHRAITMNWLHAIVQLRLGASVQDPLRDLPESSGWLGHADIGVTNWAEYPGDRRAASWFPSEATAREWWEFSGKPTIIRSNSSAVTDH